MKEKELLGHIDHDNGTFTPVYGEWVLVKPESGAWTAKFDGLVNLAPGESLILKTPDGIGHRVRGRAG